MNLLASYFMGAAVATIAWLPWAGLWSAGLGWSMVAVAVFMLLMAWLCWYAGRETVEFDSWNRRG